MFFAYTAPAQAAFFPNDLSYNKQWYLDKILAHEAWEKINTSPDITVAIIDSGVMIDHPDLKSNIWINPKEITGNNKDDDRNGFIDDINGWDFVRDVPDITPKFSGSFTESGISHGTMVSGIIGAVGDNARGVAGVTWKVKLMPLRALDEMGEGKMSAVVRAIDYAINNGADIINLSFVGFSYSESLKEALERAYRAGVLVVAAAGNDQVVSDNGYNVDRTPLYPACYEGDNGENLVIGVAATDTLDQKAPFSSYGANCIDIAAPGVSYFSTAVYNPNFGDGLFDKYYDGYWSGTSMATALVSGSLALIKQANPILSRDQIINVLLRSSDNIDNVNPEYVGRLGVGRVNLKNAVNWAAEILQDYSGYILISPYSTNYQRNLRFDEHVNKVKLAKDDGTTFAELSYSAAKMKWGINNTSGDINGDGQKEIISSLGAGALPEVSIFDLSGKLKKKFLAYDKNFRGGVNVASGDINGDGREEIITTPAFASTPLVKIFDGNGKLLKEFLAYDKNFRGGVNVAVGNVDGDNLMEIVTAPAVGGGPQVRIFGPDGKVRGQFMVYDKNFKGGVKVAVANIDGRADKSKAEIIVAPQSNSKPLVKVYSDTGNLKKQFLAYDDKFKSGISLSAGDVNQDGYAEIITGAAPGGAPHVRVFSGVGDLLQSFYAYKDSFVSGVNVGFILVSN
jgi:subtilisin family serine protease